MDTRVLLIGSGGREDAIARSIVDSDGILYSVMAHKNPSISRISKEFIINDETDYRKILDYSLSIKADMVFVGPDPVLETPLVDELLKKGIPVASPTYEAAKIETSKTFMRDLLSRHNIGGNIMYRKFYEKDEVEKFLNSFDRDVAVKPVGLTGGKGVKVIGEQLRDKREAIEYADQIISRDGIVLIEEKIEGEEFSLQAFTDGKDLSFMPIVQDYKRANEGDTGPNTGGMGSISDRNFSLPFLSANARSQAENIMKDVVRAMNSEGFPFKGVLYGQFMDTVNGVKVVEINARFADPEGINVLSLLKDNFIDILYRIYNGNIKEKLNFEEMATVLKYIVPPGYGSNPVKTRIKINEKIRESEVSIFYASVTGTLYDVETTSSRSLALLSKADDIPTASKNVEDATKYINGNYYMRHDIGTEDFIGMKIARYRNRFGIK